MPERPGGRFGDEPSPEDRLAGRTRWSGPPAEAAPPVNILVGDANLDLPVNCIKGIREVLQRLSNLVSQEAVYAKVPIDTAAETFERFKAGERPLLLGYAPTREQAAEIAEAGVNASDGNLVLGYNMTAQDLAEARSEHEKAATDPQPPPQPTRPALITPSGVPGDDFEPSIEAAKSALNLLAMHDGNVTVALFWARVLRSSSQDEMWDEVAGLIAASFPIQWKAAEDA